MQEKDASFHNHQIEWLKDPENASAFLNAVLQEGDRDSFLLALRDIAEANGGISSVAERSSVRRESLYRMLSRRGTPAISNLTSMLHSLGLKIVIMTEQDAAHAN